MQRSFVWLFVLTLFSICIFACSPAKKGSLELDLKDNGSTVNLSVGDQLTIVLEGNPTTGYLWELGSEVDGIIKLLGEPDYEADSDLSGGGGKYTFRFEAASSGETRLRLIYHRPFEKDVPPIEVYKLMLVVE